MKIYVHYILVKRTGKYSLKVLTPSCLREWLLKHLNEMAIWNTHQCSCFVWACCILGCLTEICSVIINVFTNDKNSAVYYLLSE